MVATMNKKNRPKRNDVPAKIDAYALRLAQIAAAHENKMIAEIVSEVVIETLEARLESMGVPFPDRPAPPKRKKD